MEIFNWQVHQEIVGCHPGLSGAPVAKVVVLGRWLELELL